MSGWTDGGVDRGTKPQNASNVHLHVPRNNERNSEGAIPLIIKPSRGSIIWCPHFTLFSAVWQAETAAAAEDRVSESLQLNSPLEESTCTNVDRLEPI